MNALRPPIANFDSASAMLRATARYLHGSDFPLLGAMPRAATPLLMLAASTVNKLPRAVQEQVYIWSGWSEAVAARKIHRARSADIAQWAVDQYPKRRYPAVAIGSSNGAAVHLWAALGIPWLPQTFLTPVARSGVHPDDPRADIAWARKPARIFIDKNRDVQLHHMHDPNQDRLMIHRFTYFRHKRRVLGEAYEGFLRQALAPGGTLILVEDALTWPTTRLSDRYLFQFGALGGAQPEEFLHGGPRVAAYLERQGSPVRHWSPPPPDGERPEAEWGFEAALRADVERFAAEHKLRVRRLVFRGPEQLSPLVADFHRHWYRRRGLPDRRLLVESFVLLEPYWTVRTGSIPFWMVFNKDPSARSLRAYLDRSDFEEIYLMLFSHGVDSIGLLSIEQWLEVLAGARRRALIGVDPRAFPRDFAVFARYNADLQRKIRCRHALPPPLPLSELEDFLETHRERYGVQWL